MGGVTHVYPGGPRPRGYHSRTAADYPIFYLPQRPLPADVARCRVGGQHAPPLASWPDPSPVLNLSAAEMQALPNYDVTLPTGVHIGKRWRVRRGDAWYVFQYAALHPADARRFPGEVAILHFRVSVDGGAVGQWTGEKPIKNLAR